MPQPSPHLIPLDSSPRKRHRIFSRAGQQEVAIETYLQPAGFVGRRASLEKVFEPNVRQGPFSIVDFGPSDPLGLMLARALLAVVTVVVVFVRARDPSFGRTPPSGSLSLQGPATSLEPARVADASQCDVSRSR